MAPQPPYPDRDPVGRFFCPLYSETPRLGRKCLICPSLRGWFLLYRGTAGATQATYKRPPQEVMQHPHAAPSALSPSDKPGPKGRWKRVETEPRFALLKPRKYKLSGWPTVAAKALTRYAALKAAQAGTSLQYMSSTSTQHRTPRPRHIAGAAGAAAMPRDPRHGLRLIGTAAVTRACRHAPTLRF